MKIADVMGRILGIAGAELDAVTKFLEALAIQFPDAVVLEEKVLAFLTEKYGAAFVDLPGTLKGIALDVATGLTGTNPDAWKGSV
jgi:hypothetical protein